MFQNRNQTYATQQNGCPKINKNDEPAHHNCTSNDKGSLTEWLLQTWTFKINGYWFVIDYGHGSK